MSDRRLMRSLRTAFGVRRSPLRRAAGWLDENLGGGSSLLRQELRHIFPDSWAFFLGEIALYCFILLVVTGIFLGLFFHASQAPVVYHGSYQPLVGVSMSDAYSSVLDLSLNVRAGLLVRQVHHWAALVFVAALMIHLLRLFFTGAYRRPRRINWVVGLSLLMLVGFNGLLGYSLPDDLLSGAGLRIAYSITESIPFLGPTLASLMFGGQFPASGIIARIYPVHIFLLPAGIAGLLGLHMGMLWLQRHTELPGPGRDDHTIVGTPMVPAYALRTSGYLMLVAGVLTAFGGLLQINPVWLYGPYTPWDAPTSAQPDWYMGWLEGAVRMFPGWDVPAGEHTHGALQPAHVPVRLRGRRGVPGGVRPVQPHGVDLQKAAEGGEDAGDQHEVAAGAERVGRHHRRTDDGVVVAPRAGELRVPLEPEHPHVQPEQPGDAGRQQEDVHRVDAGDDAAGGDRRQ